MTMMEQLQLTLDYLDSLSEEESQKLSKSWEEYLYSVNEFIDQKESE